MHSWETPFLWEVTFTSAFNAHLVGEQFNSFYFSAITIFILLALHVFSQCTCMQKLLSFLCRVCNFLALNSIMSCLVSNELDKIIMQNTFWLVSILPVTIYCIYAIKKLHWAFSGCVPDFQRIPTLLELSVVSYPCIGYFLKSLNCSAVMLRWKIWCNCSALKLCLHKMLCKSTS